MIETLAKTNLPVLLLGPTGCGKSYLAKKIHQQSTRRYEPFMAVNLSALPKDLVESELFGHEAGAFTGAHKTKRGLLEQVAQGTLFLDEIGEIHPELQKKLLLILEEREFRPVGSERVIKLRCKLIFATHQALEELIAVGKFRSDLYYRIAGHCYRVKSLAETLRSEPHFIEEFYEGLCDQGMKRLLLSTDCLTWMNSRQWPGNLRQLKMALESALDLLPSNARQIDAATMMKTVAAQGEGQRMLGDSIAPLEAYHQALATFERDYFERAMKQYQGRINQISRGLGVNKTTLLAKLRRYDMKAEQFKKTNLQLLKAC